MLKPIIFNTEMTRALLHNKKTVTRRIAQKVPRETHRVEPLENGTFECHWGGYMPDVPGFVDGATIVKAPFKVNDVLYVRETWTLEEFYDNEAMIKFRAGGYICIDYECEGDTYRKLLKYADSKWIPSLFMPKEAARIFLKVTSVRLERLQDITEEQAVKEGVSRLYDDIPEEEYSAWVKNCTLEDDKSKTKEDWGYTNYLWHGLFGSCGCGNWRSDGWEYQGSCYDSAVDSFSSLWNSTLQKEDIDKYGWHVNPYVFVIEFERCEKPEPCVLAGLTPAENRQEKADGKCVGYNKSEDESGLCEMCVNCHFCERSWMNA